MQFEGTKEAMIGTWRGTKQLYLDPPDGPPLTSSSALTISPVAGGSFLQCHYDWSYEGETQTGMLLFGYDEENTASAAWVDSFHMSSKVMPFAGAARDQSLELLGSYAAPPGPDWGWRITIRPVSADALQFVMHNISPEGQEDLAVQIDYTRNA